MKRWQLGLVVLGLLVLVYGMNVVSQMQRNRTEAEAKAMKESRLAAEQSAREAHGHAPRGPHVVEVPPDTGPQDAPVYLEVFIDPAACHQANVDSLREITDTYGDLVRVDWHDMSDAEVARRSDELRIGCQAAILINGEIDARIEREGGAEIVSFKGPVNSKDFQARDLYAAINAVLEEKGIEAPEQAQNRSGERAAPPAG